MLNPRADLLRLISKLEKDLQENPDPRPAQLAALRTALGAFNSGEVQASANSVSKSGKHRTGEKKERFRSLVGDLIDKAGGPVHRSDILKHLQEHDFFNGHNPERAMSKYLTIEKAFTPAGDGMWRRKQEGAETKAGNDG